MKLIHNECCLCLVCGVRPQDVLELHDSAWPMGPYPTAREPAHAGLAPRSSLHLRLALVLSLQPVYPIFGLGIWDTLLECTPWKATVSLLLLMGENVSPNVGEGVHGTEMWKEPHDWNAVYRAKCLVLWFGVSWPGTPLGSSHLYSTGIEHCQCLSAGASKDPDNSTDWMAWIEASRDRDSPSFWSLILHLAEPTFLCFCQPQEDKSNS